MNRTTDRPGHPPEHLILFAVTALGDDAYGGAIRAHIEERGGRIVSSGAIRELRQRRSRIARLLAAC